MKRKKRAEKSVTSLQERIEEHKLKLEQAKKEGKLELVSYYEKELEALNTYLMKKKKLLKN
ncbi:MAG TPA: hypothetical protein VJJ21_01710 [Candidatus Nanoarchaeia archaeon]|nr:hypothetical protein [Candidatus Nanoarchaeia archaeon]